MNKQGHHFLILCLVLNQSLSIPFILIHILLISHTALSTFSVQPSICANLFIIQAYLYYHTFFSKLTAVQLICHYHILLLTGKKNKSLLYRFLVDRFLNVVHYHIFSIKGQPHIFLGTLNKLILHSFYIHLC